MTLEIYAERERNLPKAGGQAEAKEEFDMFSDSPIAEVITKALLSFSLSILFFCFLSASALLTSCQRLHVVQPQNPALLDNWDDPEGYYSAPSSARSRSQTGLRRRLHRIPARRSPERPVRRDSGPRQGRLWQCPPRAGPEGERRGRRHQSHPE